MKATHRDTLINLTCSILGVGALMVIAIHKEYLAARPDDKIYPSVLTASVFFLHWLVWQIYFELVGLPKSESRKISTEKLWRKSKWNAAIFFGYFFLITSVFNFYTAPKYADASRGVDYTLTWLAVGLAGQIIYITRYLITQKYRKVAQPGATSNDSTMPDSQSTSAIRRGSYEVKNVKRNGD